MELLIEDHTIQLFKLSPNEFQLSNSADYLFQRLAFHTINYRQAELVYHVVFRDDLNNNIQPEYLHFHIENNSAICGYRCTFGAIQKLPEKVLNTLCTHIKNNFSVENIIIKWAGDYLNHQNFEVCSNHKTKDITQYFNLNNELLNNCNKTAYKRINRSINANELTFDQIDFVDLEPVYEVIKQARVRKGYPVTMSFFQLKTMLGKFPKEYSAYSLQTSNGDIASAAITIQLSSKVVLLFYMGHHENFDHVSPNNYMVYKLHERFKQNGFQYLDLGISTVEGELNEGLYDFKNRLGAINCLKIQIIKKAD